MVWAEVILQWRQQIVFVDWVEPYRAGMHSRDAKPVCSSRSTGIQMLTADLSSREEED
jgi:hypothetical protein